MNLNLPFLYSQWDSRWANLILGFNASNSGFNFYNYACLITCLAMIARYYKKNYDPIQINDALKSMGAGKGFGAGSGDYAWGGFHLLFGDIEEKHVVTPDALTDTQIAEIKSALDLGYPVMVQLDYNPKTVALETHFVLITGYNPNDENDFTISDPLGGKTHSLKDYLGWFRPSARNTIEQYAIYKGPVPTASPKDVLVPGDVFPQLVFKSTQWDQTVNEYLPGSDPKATTFENLKAVITGIKSRITDLTNQLQIALTEQANREEQVSRLKVQVADSEKLRADLTGKLNEALKGSASVVGVYEGQLKIKQATIDAQGKQIGSLNQTITSLQAENKKLKESSTASLTISDLFSLILKKLHS